VGNQGQLVLGPAQTQRASERRVPHGDQFSPPWSVAGVADGEFESVEDAVRLAVAGLMTLDTDDLAWAMPLVDKARTSLARGEGIPAESVKAEIDAYLKSTGARCRAH
jgi:hypothetical protein